MLNVQNLHKSYQVGKTTYEVLKGVSLSVQEGEFVAVMGPSGSGKTTLLNCISCYIPADSGSITLRGEEIARLDEDALAEVRNRKLGFVFQDFLLLDGLTVRENLKLGAYTRPKSEWEASLREVYTRFPRLEERKNQPAGTLSGGEQQMLAMGRALMAKPRILLLDEPSMGLSPLFVGEVFKIIQEVSAAGTTVLLVEQNAKKALSIANRAYVLETGRVSKSGSAADLLNDDAIKKAYLGE